MGLKPNGIFALAAIAAGLVTAGPAPAQPTPIEEIVIYGLDGDYGMSGEGGPPGRLFRFVPADGSFRVIGDTRQEGTGLALWDWEAMCYIPDGPHQGAYAVPCEDQAGPPSMKLVSISMFDASCTVVGSENLGNVRGMTVAQIGGQWKILAVRTSGNTSRLSVINPASGAREGAEVLIDSDPGPGVASMRLYGLARDVNGVLYGVEHVGNNSQIWVIDRNTGQATAPGPAANARRVEALEVAVGDAVPALSGLPAATDAWPFDGGVLMGFGDNDAMLYVFNTATGAGVPLPAIAGNAVTVPWTDIEGIIFLTRAQDPQNFIVEVWD